MNGKIEGVERGVEAAAETQAGLAQTSALRLTYRPVTLDAFLPLPPRGFDVTTEYRLKPRPKRAFNTILDANRLLVPGSKGSLAFRSVGDGHIELATRYEIASGAIEEAFLMRRTSRGLESERLQRRMYDIDGETRRTEDVQFGIDLGLAPNTYPEVLLPLMLGWPAPQRAAGQPGLHPVPPLPHGAELLDGGFEGLVGEHLGRQAPQ